MDKIAILDFGGQYAHLIANRVRRSGVYSEIFDGEIKASELVGYKGLILSGGPASVSEPGSVKCDPEIFNLGVPILAICYGHQLVAKTLGGEVQKGHVREYGPAKVEFISHPAIFVEAGAVEDVWMSHFDQVVKMPEGFELIGKTADCPIAAMADLSRNIFCLQFHPEVTHTPCGKALLENFVNLTGAKKDWNIDTYIESILQEIKEKVGDNKVFMMVSGGVDSTVAFMLLDKALGKERVYGLFVDTGFLRLNEREQVVEILNSIGVDNLHVYDAASEYFEALKGVFDPEEKRKIIGDKFLEIQQKVSADLNLNPEEWLLGQGTIYPDTIETGGTKHADKIKTHHNRVEQVQKLIEEGKVIEPLAQLYKDEVRFVGEKLGLPARMVWRHPFPGPGLAVRCLCAKEEAYPENNAELEKEINEFVAKFDLKARVLPVKSVGVQGDERSYRNPVVLFGSKIDWSVLSTLGTQLTNQFSQVNRVLFGLSPASFDTLVIQEKYLTPERIRVNQIADKAVMDYIVEAGIDKDIWQFPTVLLPLAVNSEEGESVVLRPVCSEEAMTANFYMMAEDMLAELTERVKKTEQVTAVFYDITNKPPGTIEWE